MRESGDRALSVAIIGAGFCGLATAWHLLNLQPPFSRLAVCLMDSKNIGQSTSGIAAGLLHPYAGARSKLNWRGLEGFQASQELLQVASSALRKPVVLQQQGILRLALQEQQVQDFRRCAELYPNDVEWLSDASCQSLAPGCAQAPGIWIKGGRVVDSASYLQGLWLACKQRGAQFEKRTITSTQEISSFDITLVTAGADSTAFSELSNLPLTKVKGQILEFAWPGGYAPLSYALNSQAYIVMSATGSSCFVGATYEKHYQKTTVDPETAMQELLPKAYALFPPLRQAALLNCYAGVRAVAPLHRPLLRRLSSSLWVLTGMGSKGLLYHALFAKELATHIVRKLSSP